MKKTLLLILGALIVLSACAPRAVSETETTGAPTSPPPPPSATVPAPTATPVLSVPFQTRALWVNDYFGDFSDPARLDELVANVSAWGFNVINVNVFCNGDNRVPGYVYNGHELPAMSGDYDMLAYLIEKAHQASPRVEVFAWVCVAYQGALTDWLKDTLGQDVRLLRYDYYDEAPNSDFIIDPEAVDIHNPLYRDWIVGYVRHIVEQYDVDGITLDYIRVMEDCMSDSCKAEWVAQGYPPEYFDYLTVQDLPEYWEPFHKRVVGDIVKRVSETTRAIRPSLKIAAAVGDEWTIWNAGGGVRSEGQDPVGWVQQGWLDFVWTMTYYNDYADFQAHVDEHRRLLAPENLVECILLYNEQNHGQPVAADVVAPQVEYVSETGLAGYCAFEYYYLQASPDLQRLFTELNSPPALPAFRK